MPKAADKSRLRAGLGHWVGAMLWLWSCPTEAQAPNPLPQAEAETQAPNPPAEATPRVADADKLAVVILGDADAALVRWAQTLHRALQAQPHVTLSDDPALVAALQGSALAPPLATTPAASPPPSAAAPSAAPPAALVRTLAELRAQTGLSEHRDLPHLQRIGQLVGARALVLLRRRAARVEMLIFDVHACAYFSGQYALHDDDGKAAAWHAFIDARLQALQRDLAPQRCRTHPRRPDAAAPSSSSREADARRQDPPRTAAASSHASPTPKTDAKTSRPASDTRRKWRRIWPVLAAGALLVGTVLYFTLRHSGDDGGPPQLRIVPGALP